MAPRPRTTRTARGTSRTTRTSGKPRKTGTSGTSGTSGKPGKPATSGKPAYGAASSAGSDVDARTRLLDAAFALFHAQGVNATGIDQILAASGTGKSQFYHYFESKEDLVVQVLRRFRERVASGEIPLVRDLRTWKDLQAWFAVFMDAQAAGGCERSCPIGTIAGELTGDGGAVRAEACEILLGAREPLVGLFTSMRAQGKLERGADPQALADFCLAVMQGGLLVSKIERRPEPFRHAVEHALAYVRSLES